MLKSNKHVAKRFAAVLLTSYKRQKGIGRENHKIFDNLPTLAILIN